MKFKLFVCLLILVNLCVFSQEEHIYQSDSIYMVNKVKLRKFYLKKHILMGTAFFDRKGRKIKFKTEPTTSGTQRTTYFEYDNNGLLINKVDTIINRIPDKKTLERLKGVGINVSEIRKKPRLEISKYKIEYSNNEISTITKFNPDGSLKSKKTFLNKDKKQTVEFYKNNLLYNQRHDEYLDYTNLIKIKSYGWRLVKEEKRKYNYIFDYIFQNDQIKQFTTSENGNKSKISEFKYNKKGLLKKIIHQHQGSQSEISNKIKYEFYK